MAFFTNDSMARDHKCRMDGLEKKWTDEMKTRLDSKDFRRERDWVWMYRQSPIFLLLTKTSF